MKPVRKWGHGPYCVAVIHGGPGAPGEVAPVARELSTITGILEPFQTATTLDGQVQELRSTLIEEGKTPVTLIGYSWGAFLSWIVAARYPELVKKLVLVASPPFEEQYAASITQTRMRRLKKKEREEAQDLLAKLADPAVENKNTYLMKLGTLLANCADSYDSTHPEEEGFHCQYDVFRGVWDEAAELRQKQVILQMAKMITCPVIAIHGETDPHPAEGVKDPLARELADFRFVLLEKCGHRPWVERYAAEKFFEVLAKEI
ncbi:MAG: alpha/beta hydrolase [Methanomicrobiales archaeon]|nr:alpha/beta hydrolase [Methanomicrobiales archaeon]